jgi:catechol 2,3-dioxygenase-like lactoylglutathione lyase family enzyme
MHGGLLLLYVEDFPAMLGFYRDTLGLEVNDVDPGPGHVVGGDWASLQAGALRIELFDHAVHGRTLAFPQPRENAVVITFEVDDVDEAVASLHAKGVDTLPIARASWGSACHFFDPEGNHLQVFATV